MDNCSTWVYVLKCLLEDKSNVFWDGKLKLLSNSEVNNVGGKMAKGQMQKLSREVLTEAKKNKR